jgi:SAM-dependent methyltransferase
MRTANFYYIGLVCLGLLGCQGWREGASSNLWTEQSVFPGINEQYLRPDLNPAEWVERFEREGREVFDHREKIVQSSGVQRGMRVADIGAGTGLFTFLFAEAVGPGGRVYAVDIVPEFLSMISERAANKQMPQVRAVLGDELSANLPANSIDLAFICDTYHHFEYPQNMLASIHRALGPGGELFMVEFKRIPGESSDWILNHVRAGQEVFTREIEEAGFAQVEEFDFLNENYIVRFRKEGKEKFYGAE